ncbi:MAG: leucine-rich repeat domain-containing protein [Lachnospiraceae bacterium]|nr:leucine-rich repeat domain-containing protein [Lachnospiraceae bacterium]
MRKHSHLKPLAVFIVTAMATTSVFQSSALAAKSISEDEGCISEYSDYVMSDHDVDPLWTATYGHWTYSDGTLYYKSGSGTSVDVPSIASEVEKIVFESGPTSVTRDFYLSDLTFSNLEEITFEAPVTLYNGDCTIETSAFANSPKLKKLTVGNYSTEGIEFNKKAFMNCTNLSDVSLGIGTWHFGYMTFGNCTSLTKFEFPDDMHNVRGDTFIGCNNLSTLEMDDSNSYMRIAANTVYEILDPYSATRGTCYNTPCLMFVPAGVVKAAGGDYTVIKGTKDIQYWAFIGNPYLKNLTVASTVEAIQHEAFYNCENLTTVTLPKSLERVGQRAFGPEYDDDTSTSKVDSEDTVEIAHQDYDDTFSGNSKLTDIYYQGSESEWKNIKLAEYDLDYGHLRYMTIDDETTLYDHLEDAGIPTDVNIHYNCTLTDTEDELDDLINGATTTMSFNSKDSADLSTLGINMEINYTSSVKYNGCKHKTSLDKANGSTTNDIDLSVKFTDSSTGKSVDTFEVKKVRYKNNKNVASTSSNKPPYFILQIKADKSAGLTSEQKKALKRVNKLLKKKSESGTKCYFNITQRDISSMTSENYKSLKVTTTKSGTTKVKFKTLALQFTYTSDGEKKSTWIKLKPCKKNNSSKKGDYTYVVNSNNTVTITGQNNYKGSATFSYS